MALIVADRVRKVYRVGEIAIHALKGLSFEIEPGSFVSFVGPSGSGKTTLLNIIGCLDKPSEGRLEVAGVDVAGLDRRRGGILRGKTIGFIFQDFNLIPVLTVYENIEYPLIMVQDVRPARERSGRVLKLLEAVGMLDHDAQVPRPDLRGPR
jgi:putative ABC transport system ATP-binding protein